MYFRSHSVTLGVLCPYSEAWMRDFKLREGRRGHATSSEDVLPPLTPAVLNLGAASSEASLLADEMYIGSGATTTCRWSACCLSVPDPGDRRQRRHYNTYEGRLWRIPACELRYGPLSCDFRIAPTNQGASMDNEDLAQVGMSLLLSRFTAHARSALPLALMAD